MNEDKAISLIDAIVLKTKGRHLITLETEIIRGTWRGLSYKKIAINSDLSDGYVGSQAAPKVWNLISEALLELGINETITKKNLKAVIERRVKDITSQLALLENNNSEIVKTSSAVTEKKAVNKLEITRQLELPKGPLPIDSNIYIERSPIEEDCYHEISRIGGLIRIKAPKQMGKTSLIIRILESAKLQGYYTAYLNFQELDRECLSNLDLFFKSFCVTVSDKLDISSEQIAKYWIDLYGIKKRCDLYFERFLLPKLDKPLVLAIDEADYIFFQEVETEFFAILRTWHEKAKREANEIWAKLRLVLGYSTEEYLRFDNNQSPFNVGLPIALPELTPSQILELTQRYSLQLSEGEIEKLIGTIGGHPYLVQLAIYHLATNKISFSEFLNTAHTEQGIYSSHLRRHLRNLEQEAELKTALCQVLEETTAVPLNSVERFKLDGMGLVKLKGNKVSMSCQLYRQYFSENLLGK